MIEPPGNQIVATNWEQFRIQTKCSDPFVCCLWRLRGSGQVLGVNLVVGTSWASEEEEPEGHPCASDDHDDCGERHNFSRFDACDR